MKRSAVVAVCGIGRGGAGVPVRWWLVLYVLLAGLWVSGEADPSWATSPTDPVEDSGGGAGAGGPVADHHCPHDDRADGTCRACADRFHWRTSNGCVHQTTRRPLDYLFDYLCDEDGSHYRFSFVCRQIYCSLGPPHGESFRYPNGRCRSDGPDASDAPDELSPDGPPAPVAPKTLAAIVECDVVPLGELAESGTVRFVAYGDVDRGDGVGCGMVPSVRLAVVNGYDDILGWWGLVGADLGIGGGLAPPGLQIPSSDERLSVVPARFLTTSPEGEAEAFIGNIGWYTVCAMSPVVQDLIAGCSHEPIWLDFGSEVYVFFSHGHAIVETGPEAAERYQRFLDGADISNQPRVSVFFLSTYLYFPDSAAYLPLPNYGFDIPNDDFNFTFLDTNVQVAVIEDAYVDAWWSDAGPLADIYGGTFYFDPGVLENEWVHVISTGYDGLVEVALPPGDYLFCHVLVRSEVYGWSLGCDHEDVPDSNGRVVVIEKGGGGGDSFERGIVFNSVNMEPEDSGRKLLEWAKTAPFGP